MCGRSIGVVCLGGACCFPSLVFLLQLLASTQVLHTVSSPQQDVVSALGKNNHVTEIFDSYDDSFLAFSVIFPPLYTITLRCLDHGAYPANTLTTPQIGSSLRFGTSLRYEMPEG